MKKIIVLMIAILGITSSCSAQQCHVNRTINTAQNAIYLFEKSQSTLYIIKSRLPIQKTRSGARVVEGSRGTGSITWVNAKLERYGRGVKLFGINEDGSQYLVRTFELGTGTDRYTFTGLTKSGNYDNVELIMINSRIDVKVSGVSYHMGGR